MDQKILVLDDDTAILEMLHDILTDEGYDVRTAHAGNAAQHAPSFHPDLILMDVRIPAMASVPNSQPGTRTSVYTYTPIILMTARQRKPHMTQAVVIDFIFKPFDLDVLLAKISGVLAASWARETRRVCQNGPDRARAWRTPETARGGKCRFLESSKKSGV